VGEICAKNQLRQLSCTTSTRESPTVEAAGITNLASSGRWGLPPIRRWGRSLLRLAFVAFVALVACIVGNAEAVEPRRIASVRSLQFEKHHLGLEMVLVLRMSQAMDVPPLNAEVLGRLQFQSGIVGLSEEAPGRSASSGTRAWHELGKFRARRSSAPDATPTELVVRTTSLHQSDQLLQLLVAATEAYAPYSQLQLRLDGQVKPVRRMFGFRRADTTTPVSLGRWSASFVASAPKNPANEIFKSPNLLGVVDATTALVNPSNNKQR